MKIRMKCPSCNTAFVAPEEAAGRRVACPKCGERQIAPAATAGPAKPAPAPPRPAVAPPPASPPVVPRAEPEESADESVFVPREEARKPRRFRWVALSLLTLATLAGVGVVVAWPMIQDWLHPRPKDPVEIVALAYLEAAREGNREVTSKLGTVDLPPAIRSFREVHRDPSGNRSLKGSFAPISEFHARIVKDYEFDTSAGRFVPKNALGPAAEVLDSLHDAKAKAEQEKVYEKMKSGDPNDLFDAAESLARPLAALSETLLAPKKILPTYRMLVEEAKPPLPDQARTLAFDFGDDAATWEALLKRPTLTLKADGPFLLERAEVETHVVDALGSAGDPPQKLRLTLTRFRLEGIDTGWRVTGARRGDAPRPAPTPEPSAKPSPGDADRTP